MAINEKALKVEEWEKELVPIITQIAQCESKIALFVTMDPEEVIGERAVSQKIGGTQGKVAIWVKEALETERKFMKEAEVHKKVIMELIKNA